MTTKRPYVQYKISYLDFENDDDVKLDIVSCKKMLNFCAFLFFYVFYVCAHIFKKWIKLYRMYFIYANVEKRWRRWGLEL
jgi:hypothetical protein